jgi:hypothetical protein
MASGPSGTPVDLKISSASLSVEIGEDTNLTFRDREGRPLPNIPTLRADDPRVAQKLVYLLPHLCSYQQLAELAPTPDSWTPPYEFVISKPDDTDDSESESEDDSLAVWKIQFKNQFTKLDDKALYVTIFNLSPAYGVSQLYPGQGASSEAVRAEKSASMIIRMRPPKLLQVAAEQPGFSMRDVIKVIITSEQAYFGHYVQPDLEAWDEWEKAAELGPEKKAARNAEIKEKKEYGQFCVASREIIT